MSEAATSAPDALSREVIEIIAGITKVPAEKLGPEIDLRRDLRFDSLLGLKVLAALEKRFDILVPDEEIDKTRTVASAIAVVRRLRAQRAAGA